MQLHWQHCPYLEHSTSQPHWQLGRHSKHFQEETENVSFSVIFVNENENGDKRENNEFVHEN